GADAVIRVFVALQFLASRGEVFAHAVVGVRDPGQVLLGLLQLPRLDLDLELVLLALHQAAEEGTDLVDGLLGLFLDGLLVEGDLQLRLGLLHEPLDVTLEALVVDGEVDLGGVWRVAAVGAQVGLDLDLLIIGEGLILLDLPADLLAVRALAPGQFGLDLDPVVLGGGLLLEVADRLRKVVLDLLGVYLDLGWRLVPGEGLDLLKLALRLPGKAAGVRADADPYLAPWHSVCHRVTSLTGWPPVRPLART